MFLGGACTYTEEIKMKLLNVKKETLEQYTVYSEQTASEMSKGALKLFGADCAVAVTGIYRTKRRLSGKACGNCICFSEVVRKK